jgi:hypothetical protein
VARAFLAIVLIVAGCSTPNGPDGGPTGNPNGGSGTTPRSSTATPAPTGEAPVTLTYTGTITESQVAYANPTQVDQTRDLELSWTYTYTGPLHFDETNLPSSGRRDWTSVEMSGSILQVSYDGFGNPTVDCSGTYEAVPELVAPPVLQNPSDTGKADMVSVILTAPVIGVGTNVVGDCGGEPNSYGSPSIPGSANVTETAPHTAFNLDGGGAQDFDRTLDFTSNPNVPDTNHLEIKSTVSLITADNDCTVSLAEIQLAAYRPPNPVAAGAQPCPLISWTNAPKGEAVVNPVNDKTQKVAIGQAVKLHADLSDGSDPTGHRIEWRFTGSPVAGFDAPDDGSHGHVVPLPSPVATRDVTVFWPAVGSSSVMLLVDGRPALTTFVSSGPTATLNAHVCGVGLDTTVAHGGLPLPVFGPGLNDVCKQSGIAWHGNMSDSSTPGTLGIIQLVLDSLSSEKGPCDVIDMPEGATNFAADQQLVYGGYTNTVPGAYEDSDSPGLPLGGMVGTFTRNFTAQDYFVYKPNVGVDAIWVPVRRLLWRWVATASPSGGGWTVTGTPANAMPTMIESTPWSQLPDWSWKTVNQNGFKCH